jgi:hypothetical protein
MIEQQIPRPILRHLILPNLILLGPAPHHLKIPTLMLIIEKRKRFDARRINPHLRHESQVRRAHELLPQRINAMPNVQLNHGFRVAPDAEAIAAVVVVPHKRGLPQGVEAVQVVQGLDRDDVAAALGGETLDEAWVEVGFFGAGFGDY